MDVRANNIRLKFLILSMVPKIIFLSGYNCSQNLDSINDIEIVTDLSLIDDTCQNDIEDNLSNPDQRDDNHNKIGDICE